jgi:hypothetical protein
MSPAVEWIRALATDIGSRRPTSPGEREAAELVAGRLRAEGLEAELEDFVGYSTFAVPFAVVEALGLAAALPRRRPLLRTALGAAAVSILATEGGLVHTPLSDALSRRPSQNVVATIEPRGAAERTLCLVCHLDTSRSGLMFHPRTVRFLNPMISFHAAAVLIASAAPILERIRIARPVVSAARIALLAGFALLAERERRGEDVPGANDNASGTAIAAVLALEAARGPLESTRIVFLATGCEESGLLGMRAFLRSRDTSGWIFLNFDSLGGPATLRYIEREGVVQRWPADAKLVELARRVARTNPDLGLEPADAPIGLTYDATAVLVRGGRALTFVAGDNGVIPNYHHPSDTAENVDSATVARALEAGREMVAAIERGEADQR